MAVIATRAANSLVFVYSDHVAHAIRGLFRRFWLSDAAHDVDDECEFHVARRTRENLARGLDPFAPC